MPKGQSIHIGLNQIDSDYYTTDGKLLSCENDAISMQQIAEGLGYTTQIFLTENATYHKVKFALLTASTELEKGDTLLVTFSGHGAQRDVNKTDKREKGEPDELPALKVDKQEKDGRNELWVLYDRMMVDNEIYFLFSKFKPGVNIIVISDSCNSGTITDINGPGNEDVAPDADKRAKTMAGVKAAVVTTADEPLGTLTESAAIKGAKQLNQDITDEVWEANEAVYESALLALPDDAQDRITASVIALSACQDNELAMDGPDAQGHGKFTEILLDVWKDGGFAWNYIDFHEQLLERKPSTQTPVFSSLGMPSRTLMTRQVFAIANEPAEAILSALDKMQWIIEYDKGLLAGVAEPDLLGHFKDSAGALLYDAYRKYNEMRQPGIARDNSIDIKCSVSDRGWTCDIREIINIKNTLTTKTEIS